MHQGFVGDASNAQFWTGLRPATPSKVPLIGRSKLPNLFLNTGHGTLGCPHAPVNANSTSGFNPLMMRAIDLPEPHE